MKLKVHSLRRLIKFLSHQANWLWNDQELQNWHHNRFYRFLRKILLFIFGCAESSLLCWLFSAAAAKSLHSCLTLCDPIDSSPPDSPVPGILQARTLEYPIDGSPPDSPVPGILQARTLEWVAISFSNAWKWKVKVKLLSLVRLLANPWAATYQAPPSMRFSRQEYWSGVPLPSPGFYLVAVNLGHSSCCSLVDVLRLLIGVTFLFVEQGLWGMQVSVVAAWWAQ